MRDLPTGEGALSSDGPRGSTKGLNDEQIAKRLNVGVGTARGYVKGMLRKLGVHSRLRALVYAARWGFVEIGPGSAR